MEVSTLLADPEAIRLAAFISHDAAITLTLFDSMSQSLSGFISHDAAITLRVFCAQPCARCPLCQVASSSLHSNYLRSVADLPWHGVAVRLELHTRKFRCRNVFCARKVFCERLPNVVAAGGRKTNRLNEALILLAFALGGEAGARTAHSLGLKISGDTLLRRIRQRSGQLQSPVKVLGVDDFAFRRGERYGTILVDLEKHQPVDLLPDRRAESLQTWLGAHPEVEVISRDRGGSYATGARLGAPQATQIADRFHLLKNLLERFEQFLHRQAHALAAAAHTVFHSLPSSKVKNPRGRPPSPLTAAQHFIEEQRQVKIKGREQQYKAVKKLHRAGVPILAIARRLKMSRNTVKKFLAADSFPARRQNKPRYSPIHRFLPHLQQRWAEGERSSRALWKEIKAQGYPGAEATLRRYLRHWRVATTAQITAHARTKTSPGRGAALSVRQVKWLLFNPEKRKEGWEEQFVNEVCHQSAEIALTQTLVREFHRLMRERRPNELNEWLEAAQASGIGELVWFANGVEQDRAAVSAAFANEWSQGQVEGQVNRLKLLKRGMYGRAKFDLLKARVLYRQAV